MKLDEKMRCIVKYSSYLIRHRFFVFLECCKRRIPFSGLKHDLSKHLPSEFFPYAFHYYKDNRPLRDKTGYYKPTDTGNPIFEIAWHSHVRRNSHHWQHHCLVTDFGEVKVYEMTKKQCLEMFCDWLGARRAQKTEAPIQEWFDLHKDKMLLHPNSKKYIEELLSEHSRK